MTEKCGNGETYFIPVGVDFLTLKVSETSVFSHDCKSWTVDAADFVRYQKKIDGFLYENNYEEKNSCRKFFLPISSQILDPTRAPFRVCGALKNPFSVAPIAIYYSTRKIISQAPPVALAIAGGAVV